MLASLAKASSARRRSVRSLTRTAAVAEAANATSPTSTPTNSRKNVLKLWSGRPISSWAVDYGSDNVGSIFFHHKLMGQSSQQQQQQRRYSLLEQKGGTPILSSVFRKNNGRSGKALSTTSNTTSSKRTRTNKSKTSTTNNKNKNNTIQRLLVQSLPEIKQRVQVLHQQQYTRLTPLSLLSNTSSKSSAAAAIVGNDHQLAERQELLAATATVLDRLEQAVQKGTVNPAGRDGREVSAVLAMLLQFFSAAYVPKNSQNFSNDNTTIPPTDSTTSTTTTTAFDQCQRLLKLLDQWNLDRHEAHYHYSLLAAVHEEQWEAASELFRQQIDRDVSGFAPVQSVSVASPVGLYAMARAAQQTGTTVVQPVMNAVVHHLALTSPSDQDKYVLAAGTALGLAGEWEPLVSYLENSYNAASLGQSLVAATMHACILCGRHDEALRIYRTMLDGNLAISSEFHWGGGQHQVLPLCRDLAMRALGEAAYTDVSLEALALLRQTLKDELAASDEALVGVLGACEYDSNWQGVIDVMFLLLDDTSQGLRIVSGSELHIPDVPDLSMPGATEGIESCYIDRARVLSSIMRTCNGAQKSGLALLSCLLVESSSPGSALPQSKKDTTEARRALDNHGNIERTLLPLLAAEDYPADLLSALMTALCGLECFDEAQSMLDITIGEVNKQSDSRSLADDAYADAKQIYEFSQSPHASFDSNERKWDSAHRHIHRIAKTLQVLKSKGNPMTPDNLEMMSFALAAAVRSCTCAEQPEAGIVFSEYVKMEVSRLQPALLSEKESLFRENADDGADRNLLLSDSLLSEEMKAYDATGQTEVAMKIFQSHVGGADDETLLQWTQCCNTAMTILATQNKLEESFALFQRLIASSSGNRVADSLLVAAQNYARAERWSDVGDVYHMAAERGFISEQLGLLAMEAVIKLDMPGPLRLLREIINDVSHSSGSNPMVWMEDHYWTVKFSVGFHHTRLLMWWNDPSTCHIDELQFAIEIFEKHLEKGLRPKGQAIKAILAHAQAFHEGYIPDHKPAIARVPREKEAWIKLLLRVLGESQGLESDARFIDEAAKALKNLGCAEECLSLVEAAMERGVRVHRTALEAAVEAASAAGMEDSTGSIRLMLN